MVKEVIAVDLDGTLIDSDLTWECLLNAFMKNPIKAIWLFLKSSGRLNLFKENLLQHFGSPLVPENLPYNAAVLSYLERMKKEGHSLILATASHKRQADQVAAHLGIFEGVFASDQTVNLKSNQKAKALVKAFGFQKFIYLGNSKDDLAVWKVAKKAICINCSESLFQKVECVEKIHFSQRPSFLKESLRLLRIYQWVKNTLLFLPLMAAHKILDVSLLVKTGFGFISFSFIASALYIINDLVDLENDRAHPRKKRRPLAAGDLQIPSALMLFLGALAMGVILSLWVGGVAFLGILALYAVMSLAYSVYFKKQALIDVLLLAALFVLRIFAGQVVSGVDLTHWFILFFGFIFLSLALAKRYAEFMNTGKKSLSGRGYQDTDLSFILSLGTSSALMSLVIFGLYINTPHVLSLYHYPAYLWGIMPFMMYTLSYIWLSAGRGKLHDDPILFIFKNRRMYFLGGFILFCVFLAKGWYTHPT